MDDFNLNMGSHTLAGLAWLAAGAFLAVNFAYPARGYGFLAVACLAGAAIMHIRGFICAHDKNATRAFELGREVGRSEGPKVPVQRLH